MSASSLGWIWLPIVIGILGVLIALYTWYKSPRPILHYTQRPTSPYDSPTPTSTTPCGPPGLMATPPLVHHVVNDAVFLYRLRAYRPTWWLASGHLQTMFSAAGWHRSPVVKYRRELLPVLAAPPGKYNGVLAIDWTLAPENAPYADDTPILVVLHGLTGGSGEGYVLRHITEMLRYQDVAPTTGASSDTSSTRRMRAVVVNARGCGGSTLASGQAYCGAITGDARQAIIHIQSRYPRAPLLGVGFSLGANIMTKYVCEEGDRCPLIAACVLANPWDLLQGSRALSKWFARRVYSSALAGNLIRLFNKHRAAFANETDVNFDEIATCRTVRDFDDRVTRRTFGYTSVDDYYRNASSAQYLYACRRPLLCVNALDDPISIRDAVPFDEARNNKWVMLVTTEGGGHSMDWFTGIGAHPSSWSPPVCGAYFQSILRYHRHHHTSSQAPTPARPMINGHGSLISSQSINGIIQRKPPAPTAVRRHHAYSFTLTLPDLNEYNE